MDTQWFKIPGYENTYEVSNTGVVRRSTDGQRVKAGYVLATGRDKHGYVNVVLIQNSIKKKYYVHRLVMLAFRGECPKGLEVNHINGAKDDNHLANLEYVTRIENMQHARDVLNRNLSVCGLKNGRAKLNDDIVRDMRKRFSEGISMKELAEIFNTPYPTVLHVVRGKTWKHVTPEPELCECGCEVAPDGSHAPACRCCECCGEFPCRCRKMDDDGDDTVIDTRWYGWVKK